MRKRGISAVVATVLIILIVAMAVTTVWVFILPVVKDVVDVGDVVGDVGAVEIVTSGGYTLWDEEEGVLEVQVERGNDGEEPIAIDFIFSINGSSVTERVLDVLDAGATKVYPFDLSYYGKPDKVGVAFVYADGVGEAVTVDDIPSGSSGGGGGGSPPVVVAPEDDSCSESWSCGSWSNCVASSRTRSCTDSNNCSTVVYRPDLSEACEMPTGDWVPPIGIPRPSFGIEESYRMYDNVSAQNPDLTYTNNSEGGFYTHYVDNSDAGCSDSNVGGHGNASLPLCTIPSPVVNGSVVEVHGGPYVHKSGSYLRLDGRGTKERPIFFRGGESEHVRIGVASQSGYENDAMYIIIENLSLFGHSIHPNDGNYVDHVVLRNSEVSGDYSGGGVAVRSWVVDNWVDNVVIYNVDIHENGPWDATEGDPDIHGIGIGEYVKNIWIVDNQMYHNAGNGVQLTGSGQGDNDLAHHVYIGRNYDNGLPNLQRFIAIKGSSDVIISENHVSSQGGYRTSEGMGFQYGPERVWFLFNKIHNVNGGIVCNSNVANPGNYSYFIGNLIYNITQKNYSDWNPNNAWSPVAMGIVGGVNRYIIGNTIHNVDGGIYTPSAGNFYIMDNIISEVTQSEARHIYIESRTSTPNSLFYNNLFSQEAGDVRIEWGSYAGDVAMFEGLTGSAIDNVEADPLFIDAANDNFSLQSGSLAVDNGIVSEVYQRFYDLYGINISVDINNVTRPQGAGWDIGAYEYS
jgi:hypothetical protein